MLWRFLTKCVITDIYDLLNIETTQIFNTHLEKVLPHRSQRHLNSSKTYLGKLSMYLEGREIKTLLHNLKKYYVIELNVSLRTSIGSLNLHCQQNLICNKNRYGVF